MKKSGWYAAVGMTVGMTLAALTGCGETYEVVHMSGADRGVAAERPLVAVMPFEGTGGGQESGLRVANSMADELTSSGKFLVVKPDVVASGIGPGIIETMPPEEAGRLLGAPYVMTGKVSEYTTADQPAVGVTASLIESATGRVVWNGTRSRNGSAAWFQEDNAGLQASKICYDLVKSLDAHSRNYGLDGTGKSTASRNYALASAETSSLSADSSVDVAKAYDAETANDLVSASTLGHPKTSVSATTSRSASRRISLSSQAVASRPLPPPGVQEDIGALIREWDANTPTPIIIRESKTAKTATPATVVVPAPTVVVQAPPVVAAPLQPVAIEPSTSLDQTDAEKAQVEPMRIKVLNS